MKSKLLIALMTVALLALAGLAFPGHGPQAVAAPVSADHAVIVEAPLQVTCNSCADCTAKLTSGQYTIVTLDQDIWDHEGNCIGLHGDASNVIFDCAGHTIDGDDISVDPEYGIDITNNTNNTIQNCFISDFDYGIYLSYAPNNSIISNTVSSNWTGISVGTNSHGAVIQDSSVNDNHVGIALSNSDNHAVDTNTVCNNAYLDFSLSNSPNNSGDNNTCNRPDGWNDQGTTGCTYICPGTTTCNSCADCTAKLDGTFDTVMLTVDLSNQAGTCITFGTDNATFDCDGHAIGGDSLALDYGIYLPARSGNTVKNCTVTDFYDAIYLENSPNNTVRYNTFNSNVEGVYLVGSDGNEIEYNEIGSNVDFGIRLDGSNSNLIRANTMTANGTGPGDAGILVAVSGGNQIASNTVQDGNTAGVWGIRIRNGSTTNSLTGNMVTGNDAGIQLDQAVANTLEYNTACSTTGPDITQVNGAFGNLGDWNTCDQSPNWADHGRSNCTYRCTLCSDGIQNGTEEGVDCGGTYCPPCSQCSGEPTTRWAPHDTPCNNDWPAGDGFPLHLNTWDRSCDLIEVCSPDLDYVIEEALLCCEHENYAPYLVGDRFHGKMSACGYAHTQAYNDDFQNRFNADSMKSCLAHYLIKAFDSSAVYMQGYFHGEWSCFGDRTAPRCSEWRVSPSAWNMDHPRSCAGPENRPDFQMGGHICEYYELGRLVWGKNGYWNSDTNFESNSDSVVDLPAHSSINRLSTGTCVDYAIALTTVLRKAGYSRDDALAVDGDGHNYNLVRFPGEVKWNYVDTVGNGGGGVYGGTFTSPDYHCCRGTPTSCDIIPDQEHCERMGCTWSGGTCTGEPAENSCNWTFESSAGCGTIDGCSWGLCVWYDYCRQLQDGCYNDAYRERVNNCPGNTAIFGCEFVGRSLQAVSPSLTLPAGPTLDGPYGFNPDGTNQICTELNPCLEQYTETVPVPGPAYALTVTKELDREEITVGQSLEVSIYVANGEPTALDVTVEERLIPGLAYNLTTEEKTYQAFSFQYHDWSLQIAAQSTATLTFTVVPSDVGYYALAPTSVFTDGHTYQSDAAKVKVVCNPNGTCDPGETYVFCPADCQTGIADGYCDMVLDSRIDPDCQYEVDPDHDPSADTDGDGVLDGDDVCALTPVGEAVDATGCACSQKICAENEPYSLTVSICNTPTAACEYFPDADQDDVPDSVDNCPNDYNPEQGDCNNNGIGDQCEFALISTDTTMEACTYSIDDAELDGAVTITASNVTLDCNGATIVGSGVGYGIYIPDHVDNVTVRNCTVRNYRYGIYVDNSSGNQLISNTLEMDGYGIILGFSSNSTVTNNTADSNAFVGLYLEGSTGNSIISNTMGMNGDLGIFIHTSSSNDFSGNEVCGNVNADFYVYESVNTGSHNTCNNPDGWNDTGMTGCTYTCGFYNIYLPIVLKNS